MTSLGWGTFRLHRVSGPEKVVIRDPSRETGAID